MTKEEMELIHYAIDAAFWFGVVWVVGKALGMGWVGSGIRSK